MPDITTLTIKEARRALDNREYSALDLTNAYLENIARRNPEIHAYLEVWADSARSEAKVADAAIARGESKPLTGIPLAIKDNILIEGRIASSASKILETYRASYDATVIKRLKAHHAVFLGRTNMDEFALGASTEHSAFGLTRNPHDLSRVPGGTSGGSTAAVAANLALGALGSDTGGSIRQPAALCGVVGLRPTYGAVSRFGLMAAASSMDQIGPIARTVDDAKVIFDAIRGHDANDSTSLPDQEFESGAAGKFVVGVPRALLKEGTDPDVQANFDATLSRLKDAGYEVRDVELPTVRYSLAVYYIINPAEVSTNLARYDGIRYGLSERADSIGHVYSKTRGAGFGPEVRRRILIGTFVLSAGYADAYYRKARAVRESIREEFTNAFASVDVIATPTTPTPAFKIGEKADDPLAMYAADIFTVPVNLAGIPAISIPSGVVEPPSTSFDKTLDKPLGAGDRVQLPVGFQLIGAHGREETLFEIAKHIERHT